MMKIFRSILHFLVTGSFALFLAACYGMPAGYRYFTSRITVKDESNQPIPGLEVKVNKTPAGNQFIQSSNNTDIVRLVTDTDGIAEINLMAYKDYHYNARIMDVDGTENGGLFKIKDLELQDKMDVTVNMEKENS